MNLQDVRQKGAKVNLGGRVYTLRYDLNAFAELEDKYGSVEEAMKKLETGSLKAVRTLIWAGLIHEHEELTEKEVGAQITPGALEELSEALNAAMTEAMPDSKKAPEGNEKKIQPVPKKKK